MHIEAFSTLWHLVSALMIFLIGLLFFLKIRKSLNVSYKLSITIYLWHSVLCMLYMVYTLYFTGDSIAYYRTALQMKVGFSPGSNFIIFLSHYLINIFNISYLGLFLFFNIIGGTGLLLFYASLKSVTSACSKNIRRLVLLVVFLPSASFWSSAIGKDSVSFLAVGLALWAALNFQKRKLLMVAAIFTIFLVRPHMAGIMVVALGGSLLFTGKHISFIKQVLIAIIVLPAAFVLVPFAANYAGIDDLMDVNEINEYVQKRQGYNMSGGGGVDIANMSPPMQVFTYLFRPLPYEAHSIFAFFSSLDNLVLLLLFLYGIRFVRKKGHTSANDAFLWFFVILSVLVLSATTANLGISVRQKWMFMPMLVYLLFAGIAAKKQEGIKKNRNLVRRLS